MAVKKNALGANPLSQGIFSRTDSTTAPDTPPEERVTDNRDSRKQNQDSINKNQESRKQNQDSTPRPRTARPQPQRAKPQKQDSQFLQKGDREAVNLRLPIELNDWLNDLLRQGKRHHGSKVPKEVWVQAALELFKMMPVDWSAIDSEETLRETLKILESSLLNQESRF